MYEAPKNLRQINSMNVGLILTTTLCLKKRPKFETIIIITSLINAWQTAGWYIQRHHTGMRGAGVAPSAANRKVQPAGSLQPTPPLLCTCPSRSWSQLCCLVGRGTCVWTTYPRLLRGVPRSGIELATFRSRVANANHWATVYKVFGSKRAANTWCVYVIP